jgi:hypothetical protein
VMSAHIWTAGKSTIRGIANEKTMQNRCRMPEAGLEVAGMLKEQGEAGHRQCSLPGSSGSARI